MRIYENIDQLSPEWFALRSNRMTASHAQAIAACGAGLKTYILELMAEYYSTGTKEPFSNHHTQRGIDLEDSAAAMFSFEHAVEVRKVGFVEMNAYVGCSPDIFVGETELGEIKCLADKGHFNMLLGGKIDSKFEWQCQMELLVCQKKACSLIFYNPNFKISQALLVRRILPDPEKFEKLQAGMIIGKRIMEEIERKVGDKSHVET